MAQLEQLLNWSMAIKPVGGTADRIDRAERWVGIDAAISMARGEKGAPMVDMEAQMSLVSRFVDWREALLVMNAKYDRCVEIAREENFEELSRRWAAMEDDLVAAEAGMIRNGVASVFFGRGSKGKWVGELLSNLMMPAAMQVSQTEFTAKAKLRIMQHAIAASLFKKKNGSWPETPDDLSPWFPGGLPIDPMTGQAFEYIDEGGVFRIQSTHLNKGGPITGQSEDNLKMQLRNKTWKEFLEE